MNVFTRSLTDELASLVKQIDAQVAKNSSKRMKGFVVLLTDDPDAAEGELKAFAKKHEIKNVPLTIFDGTAGPPNYRIAKDAIPKTSERKIRTIARLWSEGIHNLEEIRRQSGVAMNTKNKVGKALRQAEIEWQKSLDTQATADRQALDAAMKAALELSVD